MAVGVLLVETIVPVHLGLCTCVFVYLYLNCICICVFVYLCICVNLNSNTWWQIFLKLYQRASWFLFVVFIFELCLCICVFVYMRICVNLNSNTWRQILLQSYQRVSSSPAGRSSCLRGTVCCAPWLLLLLLFCAMILFLFLILFSFLFVWNSFVLHYEHGVVPPNSMTSCLLRVGRVGLVVSFLVPLPALREILNYSLFFSLKNMKLSNGGTLSILNGSIVKAWATRRTAAERTIIRETMLTMDPKSCLNDHTGPHSHIYSIPLQVTELVISRCVLFVNILIVLTVHLISLCCWGRAETKENKDQNIELRVFLLWASSFSASTKNDFDRTFVVCPTVQKLILKSFERKD